MNYGPSAPPVNETAFHRGPRSTGAPRVLSERPELAYHDAPALLQHHIPHDRLTRSDRISEIFRPPGAARRRCNSSGDSAGGSGYRWTPRGTEESDDAPGIITYLHGTRSRSQPLQRLSVDLHTCHACLFEHNTTPGMYIRALVTSTGNAPRTISRSARGSSDPSFFLALDHRPQPRTLEQAHVHLPADLVAQHALEILEVRAGRQRLTCGIDIRPLAEPPRLLEHAVNPHGRAGGMPCEHRLQAFAQASRERRITASHRSVVFSEEPHAIKHTRRRRKVRRRPRLSRRARESSREPRHT